MMVNSCLLHFYYLFMVVFFLTENSIVHIKRNNLKENKKQFRRKLKALYFVPLVTCAFFNKGVPHFYFVRGPVNKKQTMPAGYLRDAASQEPQSQPQLSSSLEELKRGVEEAEGGAAQVLSAGI